MMRRPPRSPLFPSTPLFRSLVDGVAHEIDRRARLQDVVATRMPAGVGEVIAQADPALDKVLNRQIAADLRAAARALEDAIDDSRCVWRRIAAEALIRDLGFVEPGSLEDVVLEQSDADIVVVIRGRQKRRVAAEVPNVRFVA